MTGKGSHKRQNTRRQTGWFLCLVLLFMVTPTRAQVPIPVTIQSFTNENNQPVTVEVIQELSFGSLAPGPSGGTVTVSPQGNRTATGSVFPAGGTFTCGIIRIKAHPKTLINIVPASTTLRYRGYQLNLTFSPRSDVSPQPPFITHSAYTEIRIGGTLHLDGSAAVPAGSYAGQFVINITSE